MLLLVPICYGQSKGDKIIKVVGVGFNDAAGKLLDAGFTIAKSDSTFKTIQTDFKQSKNKAIQLSLFVRIKDSIAIITGKTFNSGLIGAKLLGGEISKEAATLDIENGNGGFKIVFGEMNNYALSFKKPVEYSK